MYSIAAAVLTLTGIIGLSNALLRMRGVDQTLYVSYTQALAAAGMALLAISVINNYSVLGGVALMLTLLGAPFGIVMFLQHRRGAFFALGVLIAHATFQLLAIVFSWLEVMTLSV